MLTITKAYNLYPGLVLGHRCHAERRCQAERDTKDVNRDKTPYLHDHQAGNGRPYLDANIQHFAGAPRTMSKKDSEFKESNEAHHQWAALRQSRRPHYASRRARPLVFDRPRQRERYPHRSLARQYGAAPGLADRHGRAVSPRPPRSSICILTMSGRGCSTAMSPIIWPGA